MIHTQLAENCLNVQSTPHEEKRICQRLTHKASISLTSLNFGFALDAVSVNHSPGGICLQTRCRLKPRSTVCLRTLTCDPLATHFECGKGLPTISMAEIKWCEKITGADGSSYYLSGLKYFPPEY
jgi:hypothetical protein